MKFPTFLPVLIAAAAPLSAATVVSPYFQNFEGYPSDQTTDFTEDNTAAYVIVTQGPGDQAYRARIAGSTGTGAPGQRSGLPILRVAISASPPSSPLTN